MENVEIARVLNEYADLLDIKGGNAFRVRSYRKAAQAVEGLSRPLGQMIEDGEDLTAIPGIGASMAEHLGEIVETGRYRALEKLKKELPGSLASLMHLEHLGPKKAKQLHDELGVSSIEELQKALAQGKIQRLRGFGKTSADKLRRAIRSQAQRGQRIRLADADQLMQPLLDHLRKTKGIQKLEVAGSYRRRKETVGDVDVLVACRTPKAVMKRFTSYPKVEEVEMAGTTRGTVVLTSGLKVDLRVVPRKSYGAALHYFTGSKAHNVAVRKLGVERGLKINEYGIFRVPKGKKADKAGEREGKRIAGEKEQDVFEHVKMAWVAPELREDRGEIEAARKDRLPKLLTLEDIRGNLHMHSKWTDGGHSIEEMARACKELGYDYCAITDHSRSTRIAGGLDAKEFRKQWQEIEEVRGRLKGITLLAGVELDILPDGSLDLSDDVLERMDVIVGSIHSHFTLSKARMTRRIVRAIEHPLVDIIGHPTERQINERDPFDVDLEEVFHAAKEHDVALELNAQPKRLDLSDVYVHRAKELGVKVAINSDAHSTDQLHFMRYGVDQARRGWLERKDVVNALTLKQLRKWLGRRR